jgi:hypothetical protein
MNMMPYSRGYPPLWGIGVPPPSLIYFADTTWAGSDMADKKIKIVSYRRAEWLSPDPNRSLEKFIRNAGTKLATVKDRWIASDDQTLRLAKMENEPTGGLRLHITTETEGEAASFIPKPPAGSTEFALGTQPPPANAEWLDGDAFLYVVDNHVCICTTSMSDSAVKVFLWEYFKKAKLPDEAAKFDLLKKADITKIRLLRTQGVKEVEIRASMFKASATYQARKSHIMSSLGAVAKHVKAILGKPNDVNPDALQVILTLKTDEREKGLSIGEKEIENIAADVVRNAEADDSYAIITKTGQRITPEELFVKTTASIERDGKTVDRDDAWGELVKFFDDLKTDGVLEQ